MNVICSTARPRRQARRDAAEKRRLKAMEDHNDTQRQRAAWVKKNPDKDMALCPH